MYKPDPDFYTEALLVVWSLTIFEPTSFTGWVLKYGGGVNSYSQWNIMWHNQYSISPEMNGNTAVTSAFAYFKNHL